MRSNFHVCYLIWTLVQARVNHKMDIISDTHCYWVYNAEVPRSGRATVINNDGWSFL